MLLNFSIKDGTIVPIITSIPRNRHELICSLENEYLEQYDESIFIVISWLYYVQKCNYTPKMIINTEDHILYDIASYLLPQQILPKCTDKEALYMSISTNNYLKSHISYLERRPKKFNPFTGNNQIPQEYQSHVDINTIYDVPDKDKSLLKSHGIMRLIENSEMRRKNLDNTVYCDHDDMLIIRKHNIGNKKSKKTNERLVHDPTYGKEPRDYRLALLSMNLGI